MVGLITLTVMHLVYIYVYIFGSRHFSRALFFIYETGEGRQTPLFLFLFCEVTCLLLGLKIAGLDKELFSCLLKNGSFVVIRNDIIVDI